MNLAELISFSHDRVEKCLTHYLKNSTSPSESLQNAMAYAAMNGGKRIRPLLVYATGYALHAPWENLDIPACAIELIHAYSLIHDDLPAMDNADLRRGKPSCHKAFNEALAILAGDALQPLAFEIIANHPAPLKSEQRLAIIASLCKASGFNGMAAGQALDLAGTRSIEEMYQLKTGALLVSCVQTAALAAPVSTPDIQSALIIFAKNIGLAFQLQDDLLDFEQPHLTGKPQGADIANQKMTYAASLGVEKTRKKIDELFTNALHAIRQFENTEILREFANYLLQRKM